MNTMSFRLGQSIVFTDHATDKEFQGIVVNTALGILYVAVLGQSEMFRVLPEEVIEPQQ